MQIDALKVPDLWFDAIARSTPGICLWLTLIHYYNICIFPDNGSGIVVVVFVGYATGLVSGSFASILAYCIEHKWFRELAVDEIRRKLGRESHQARVLSKMHGETVAFLNFMLLSAVFLYIAVSHRTPTTACTSCVITWAIVVFCISFLAACSSACRRSKRSGKYANDLNRQTRLSSTQTRN